MSSQDGQPAGPDLASGFDVTGLKEMQSVAGHVQGKVVLLARTGGQVFAISGKCTHYGGPLAEGLIVGETVRCPWHHACFSLRTGEALRAPALNPVDCWSVEQRGDKVYVTSKAVAAPRPRPSREHPQKIIIVGAGGAGNAAAEMLRREGFAGSLTLIGEDPSIPYDRPNLSKDYLAGTAPEDWIPLRSRDFYAQQQIDLVLGTRVKAIDPKRKQVRLENEATNSYDSLLLATGANPVRLKIPGSELPHVHTLRTLADSQAIIARAKEGSHAVVIGASFIGLEVAASLRARNVSVHVVSPEAVPMERILGRELGEFIRQLHEEHGVVFHLGQTARAIDEAKVTLADGNRIEADLVVAGIGVRPAIELAEQAGLAIDNGVLVDELLQTSAPDVFAAGDIARWPDPHSGERIRVEHWVVAERQGQTAARNMLGFRERFDQVPFFWSAHYDVTISYVGHASRWDRLEMSGSLQARDCRIELIAGGKLAAVATIGRDRESLEAEVEMERVRSSNIA